MSIDWVASGVSFDPLISVWLVWTGIAFLLLHAWMGGRAEMLIHRVTETVDPVLTLVPIGGVMFLLWLTMLATFSTSATDARQAEPRWLALQVTVSQAVPAIFAFWMITRTKNLQQIGVFKGGLAGGVLAGLLGIIIALPFVTWAYHGSIWFWDYLQYQHPARHAILQQLQEKPIWWVQTLLILSAVVIAPVFEELLFRGLIQTSLRKTTRLPMVAIILTSIVFAAVHEPWTAPAIFVLSVCIGAVYEVSRNLWAVVIMHGLFNAFAIITRG